MLNEESNMKDMIEVLEDMLELFQQAKIQYVKQYMKLDIPKSFTKSMLVTLIFDALIEGVEQTIIDLEDKEDEGVDLGNMINAIIKYQGLNNG